jgi:hypothetical protein
MQPTLALTRDILDVVVQVLIVIVPLVLSWFVRTYIRSASAQNKIATIARLSNAAIDYVENLDKRGDLVLPAEVKKGGYKLKVASQWAENELKRAGINVTNEQAQTWIAAEFQKRAGGVLSLDAINSAVRHAVDLIQNVERSQPMDTPTGSDRVSYLASLAADYAVTQLAGCGIAISREEALIWVRSEFLQRLQDQVSTLPAGDRLMRLAVGAVDFLERLKVNGQIAVRPGTLHEDIEADIATAWLLTEAAKQGLDVTSEQIARSVAIVLRQRRTDSQPLQTSA